MEKSDTFSLFDTNVNGNVKFENIMTLHCTSVLCDITFSFHMFKISGFFFLNLKKICDAIKQNQSELAKLNLKIQPSKMGKFPLFSTVSQNLQLCVAQGLNHQSSWGFHQIKAIYNALQKMLKNKKCLFSALDSFCLITSHMLLNKGF